jgi:hypothetical protein
MTDAPIVEWHRVSGSRAILRPLLLGAAILSLGPAIAVAGIVLGRHTPGLVNPSLTLAGLFVFTGPVVALMGLSRAFKEDAVLAARATGVTFERNGRSIALTWDELEAIVFSPPNALVFKRREGDPFVLHETFDIATDELAKRFETLRRKASMDLLPKA